MNKLTERFECVLPDRLRMRYRSPAPPPPYIRPKPRRRAFNWLAIGATLICVSVLASALLSRRDVPISSPPAPMPVPASTPVPVPVPVEVRKAGYVLHREFLMPYGEKLMSRYLGSVPNQESLPLTGNHIGDCYSVGSYEFVWVSPGVWIDPI